MSAWVKIPGWPSLDLEFFGKFTRRLSIRTKSLQLPGFNRLVHSDLVNYIKKHKCVKINSFS